MCWFNHTSTATAMISPLENYYVDLILEVGLFDPKELIGKQVAAKTLREMTNGTKSKI